MKKIFLTFVSSFLLTSAFACGMQAPQQTYDHSMYLGIQGGLASDGLPQDKKIIGDMLELKKEKAHNLGARLFWGYNFNKYIAFEGGFLVTDNREIKLLAFKKDLIAKAKINEKILDFTPRVNIPLGYNFSIYARAGIAYIDALNGDKDIKGFNYVYGAGLDYNVTNNMQLGIGYAHYNGSDNKIIDIFDKKAIPSLDFYSVSISYKFAN